MTEAQNTSCLALSVWQTLLPIAICLNRTSFVSWGAGVGATDASRTYFYVRRDVARAGNETWIRRQCHDFLPK